MRNGVVKLDDRPRAIFKILRERKDDEREKRLLSFVKPGSEPPIVHGHIVGYKPMRQNGELMRCLEFLPEGGHKSEWAMAIPKLFSFPDLDHPFIRELESVHTDPLRKLFNLPSIWS
ncbi:MAG: hypothetical protein A2174_00580 [Candidatus Portnoybacteria bacterium RBG_13_41_18]|uniref:Uncharacterized protein n=1 Tax=Candidatus Portnoybacteria bacterium RBG_13_41_18 TaxID=1801991 RepID=A0A1G2FAG9_9BACT|nr:MAG: hypothetical protein A2174_00580 [Candidatus Portnoybacteria bacterium RBG_13_41_18]